MIITRQFIRRLNNVKVTALETLYIFYVFLFCELPYFAAFWRNKRLID